MRRFGRILLIVFLGIVFISTSSFAWGKKGKKSPKAKSDTTDGTGVFVYNSHGRKDPILPVVDSNGTVLFVEKKDTGKTTVNITIQGIIFKKKGVSKVMISNHMYIEGERVGMLMIKKINRDNIIVTDGTKEYTVEI